LSAMPRAPSASPGCGPGSGSCPERGFSEIKFSKPRFSEPRFSEPRFSTRPLFSADPSNRAVHQSRRNRPENCGSRGDPGRGSGPSHQCHSVHWDRAHRGAGGLFVPASRRIVPDGEFRIAPRWGCGSSHLRNLLRVHDDSYFRFPRAPGVSGCHAQGGQCAWMELSGARSSGHDSPSFHSVRTSHHASFLAGDWSGSGGHWRSAGLSSAASAPASVNDIPARSRGSVLINHEGHKGTRRKPSEDHTSCPLWLLNLGHCIPRRALLIARWPCPHLSARV
jgi:hypothetical protein